MKKVRVAIIGQGRSGRNIHGRFLRSEQNTKYQVVAVVERDEARRARALEEYPGCRVYTDYTELLGQTDIDLVVNASYSQDHYPITRDLMEHGFNVLVEKPMARNYFEAATLLGVAKQNNVMLAVFQQSFLAPHFLHAQAVINSGKLGEIKEIKLRNNGFGCRYDWQTLQENVAGSVYNTGPHPLGHALAFLDFSDDVRVAYSKLDTVFTSGDAADFAKIILVAPGKPLMDLELHSNDAYDSYMIRVLGTKGCYETTGATFRMKYIIDGEAPEQPVETGFLSKEDGLPAYCKPVLIPHDEEGELKGDGFVNATEAFYDMMYETLVNGAELTIKPENIAKLVNIIERIHAENPLPVKFVGGKYV